MAPMRDFDGIIRLPIDALEYHQWFYVYRYYDAAGCLLYVGATRDPYLRWTQHRRRQPWAADVTHVEVEKFAYEDLAYSHERRVIREMRPRYNIKATVEHEAELAQRLAQARADAKAEREMSSDEMRLP